MDTNDEAAQHSADPGQALGLVLISIALIAAVAAGMMALAGRMTDRAGAQTAADAAALAGVEGGAPAAAEAAGRNGASLHSFERTGAGEEFVVTVVVGVGEERAIARASSRP